MFEDDVDAGDAGNIASHRKQNIQPELARESYFEEHARRVKTTAKMIFNGSVVVKVWRVDSSCWRLPSRANPHDTAWRGVPRTPN
jgi:hypothetical protein